MGHARDWHFFRHFLHDANPPYTPREIERYVEACSQPRAAAGMINYYRASVRQSQKEAAAKLRPISAPTLIIWGERDSYLGPELAEPDRDDVPNLDRVERLPDASHWVHHDEAERVNQLLIDFFAPARTADLARSGCLLGVGTQRPAQAYRRDEVARAGDGQRRLTSSTRRSAVMTTTHLGSGDASGHRRDYRPEWLNNLADDVTMEGSVLTGIAEGPEAIRAILGFARRLYEYQEFNFVGPYGDHGFVEDYTSVVRGEPIGSVVVVRFNEARQAGRIVVNHRPLRSVLLRSQLMGEHFADTPYAKYFLSHDVAEALREHHTRALRARVIPGSRNIPMVAG